MKFNKGWDTLIIDELSKCGHKKPILSVYPCDFDT